jgi:hypothetical protein
MRLSNCNCGKRYDCGCVPYFDEFLNNTVSVLSVGNLVSDNCVFDEYVIDWYRDGEHAMVTGKGYDPDIQEFHPFMGEASLPVVGGQWKPIIRYVVVEGIVLYPTIQKCKNWCSDLDAVLPSVSVPTINVNNLSCGLKGGGAHAYYDYRISYATTQDFSQATKTFRFYLDEDTAYVAYQFTGAIVADQIEIYFMEEQTPLVNFIVGTGLAGDNHNVTPMEFDTNSIRSVVNLTGKTLTADDYLTIQIKPAVKEPGNYNTVWSLDLICLPEDTFPCNEYNQDMRTIDVNSVNSWFDEDNCRYLVSFSLVAGHPTRSPFRDYFNPSLAQGTGHSMITTTGYVEFRFRKFEEGNSAYSFSSTNYVTMIGTKLVTKTGNILTFEFSHLDDYNDYKNQYGQLLNNSHYQNYSEDPESIHHYKWLAFLWRETLLGCGDTYTQRTFTCHMSSPVTFNDAAKSITIEMLNVENGLERRDCYTVPNMADSFINLVNSSINAADFSGETNCRNLNPFNLRYQYMTIRDENVLQANNYLYLRNQILDTVCNNPDWYVYSFNRYAFNLFFVRITLTDPDNGVDNFRIESQVDILTGASTGVWEIIYEKQNGTQIIP